MPMWRTGSGDLAAGLIFKPSTSALMTGAASTPVVANYGLALWGLALRWTCLSARGPGPTNPSSRGPERAAQRLDVATNGSWTRAVGVDARPRPLRSRLGPRFAR